CGQCRLALLQSGRETQARRRAARADQAAAVGPGRAGGGNRGDQEEILAIFRNLNLSLPGRRESGVTRQSIVANGMDARVKPAHDSKEGLYMLEGFKRSEIKTGGARIVTVKGGSGPALLLMHGNPFTHLSWLKVAPALAREFTVICTDLRGYGDSEKPPGGDDHSGYSFRAMAQDQVEVMSALGYGKFFAAGHDRGGRVLHRMCLDHPAKVTRAAI